MTELSDQISQHLEFVGFESNVEFDEENPSEFTVSTSHPNRWNFRLIVDGGTVTFMCFVNLETKTFDYKLANEVNQKLKWIKVFIDEDGDLGFFMYLSEDYHRRSFGLAIDRFDSLIDSAMKIISPPT